MINHPSYKPQPSPHEAIILTGRAQPPEGLDAALASMDDGEDYELRTCDDTWWIVYTSPYRAPDSAVCRAALADLRRALEGAGHV